MLRINWMNGLANLPHFTLEDSLDLMTREECEFTFINGLWVHVQENGLVRYFAHTGQDRNEGGFGGATFTFLHNGEPRSVIGPWSSRASYVNMVMPDDKQIVDITLDNGKQFPIHVGMLLSEFVKHWDSEDAYLLRAVHRKENGEGGPYTASLAPNCILKPDGMRLDKAQEYEVVIAPEGK